MDERGGDRAAAEQELVALIRRALAIADRHQCWLAAAHLDRALISLDAEPPAFELPN